MLAERALLERTRHLNDVLLLHPVFFEGEVAMFAPMRCHWNDVGGMTPGSLSGRVNEIYQEGIRITPTKLADRGELNQAFVDRLEAKLSGEKIDTGKHNMIVDVKAVSFHMYKVEKTDDGWKAFVILDV